MRITEKELQRFVQRLRQEEKSGATVEKYCREAARFACWLDGRDAVKDLALAYKAVLVRERAPAGVNGAVAALNRLFRDTDLAVQLTSPKLLLPLNFLYLDLDPSFY